MQPAPMHLDRRFVLTATDSSLAHSVSARYASVLSAGGDDEEFGGKPCTLAAVQYFVAADSVTQVDAVADCSGMAE